MMTSRRAIDTPQITAEKLLLVEGLDDRRFFSVFARYLRIVDVQVELYGGKDNLGNFLALLSRNPQFAGVTTLGIVRDADRSRQSAFDSVAGSLRRAGLPTPSELMRPATENGLSVSVLIIPPDADNGELEDLCLSTLGDNDPVLPCVDQYLDCAANAGVALPERSKSRLHAYLAAAGEPGRRLGEAADAGVWDWSSPAFDQVADFLRNL